MDTKELVKQLTHLMNCVATNDYDNTPISTRSQMTKVREVVNFQRAIGFLLLGEEIGNKNNSIDISPYCINKFDEIIKDLNIDCKLYGQYRSKMLSNACIEKISLNRLINVIKTNAKDESDTKLVKLYALLAVDGSKGSGPDKLTQYVQNLSIGKNKILNDNDSAHVLAIRKIYEMLKTNSCQKIANIIAGTLQNRNNLRTEQEKKIMEIYQTEMRRNKVADLNIEDVLSNLYDSRQARKRNLNKECESLNKDSNADSNTESGEDEGDREHEPVIKAKRFKK
jgi:hypothetical protein